MSASKVFVFIFYSYLVHNHKLYALHDIYPVSMLSDKSYLPYSCLQNYAK